MQPFRYLLFGRICPFSEVATCFSWRNKTKIFICIPYRMVVSMVYYGLSLNTGNLGGDFYLNFTLSGLVEFPAYTLCLLLLDRIGRKFLHFIVMVLGGLACISTVFTTIFGGEGKLFLPNVLTLVSLIIIREVAHVQTPTQNCFTEDNDEQRINYYRDVMPSYAICWLKSSFLSKDLQKIVIAWKPVPEKCIWVIEVSMRETESKMIQQEN